MSRCSRRTTLTVILFVLFVSIANAKASGNIKSAGDRPVVIRGDGKLLHQEPDEKNTNSLMRRQKPSHTMSVAKKVQQHLPAKELATGASVENSKSVKELEVTNVLQEATIERLTNEVDTGEKRLSALETQANEVLEATIERLTNEVDTGEKRLSVLETAVGNFASASHEDGSRVPKFRGKDGSVRDLTLFERMRYLEHKVDGATNWLKDPQLFDHIQHTCTVQSDLGTDHHVCFDGWEKALARHPIPDKSKKCVVYDLGIRANPEFGVNMMEQHGCTVRAYDPSPIAKAWWAKQSSEMKENNKYTFWHVGAGGEDGSLELFNYNWDQVSIYKAENDQTLRPPDSPDLAMNSFTLPVKTLGTMMKDNGDSYIDVMKIDIEGSEYLFLQDMFDRMGCPPVGQLTIEWHNFELDSRYGSSPEVNTIQNLLNSCGYKAFYNRDHWRMDPHVTQGSRVLPPMRITLSSYCKDCI